MVRPTVALASWLSLAAMRPRLFALTVLVGMAGRRWRVEECFQRPKGLAQLDEHQGREDTS
ncbi:hypothetical protein CDO52_21550 [Nocardiopsis gilva YIM 90087]|uniref:Uncharacterized protein n=1 Tax=Nocardiopsis gilva YIM 90087 TaxID=1235441 RepID=A0A223SA92_9ACTN|nr:hypothetical protein [Nocardiopsis gilva]ASU85034.1 hypothetical protein CDO52_21550 [Nocardiopsis gilva YIM 90087]